MNRILRDVRLIPIVVLATVSLLVLKVSGLVFDGGYTLADRLQGRDKTDMKVVSADSVPDQPKIIDERVTNGASRAPQAPSQPWAQQMFNYNDNANRDITGSVGGGEDKPADGPPLKTSNKAPDPPKLEVAGASIPLEQGRVNSPGERAVLERLQDRRQELDARNRELDMRENLIKAAEKRLEAKVLELKDLQASVNTAVGNRDAAEVSRFKGIVSMYENMKPKDAARIFDRLDLKVLLDVSTLMNPRKMSDVLAQMQPDAAERLTVELANRASAQAKPTGTDQLPKIEGKPGN
ncbi:MAG TPA: flagellar protein FlbB [Pseudolabrys sp.]|jgi:flagellar motility protein MotE (MotC chaperone)